MAIKNLLSKRMKGRELLKYQRFQKALFFATAGVFFMLGLIVGNMW